MYCSSILIRTVFWLYNIVQRYSAKALSEHVGGRNWLHSDQIRFRNTKAKAQYKVTVNIYTEMNFKQKFSNSIEIEHFLIALGILHKEKIFIQIDNHPDYDLSEYRRDETANYFFSNSWDFRAIYQSVLDFEFSDSYVLHADQLTELGEEYNIPINYTGMDVPRFLDKVRRINEEAIEAHAFPTDLDQFKLHHLRKRSIDNIRGRLYYEGSFIGSSNEVDATDWGIYSLSEITAIPLSTRFNSFFNELISEAYILLIEGKWKLLYFVAYSAFESFVNERLSTGDEKQRLEERLKMLFKIKFPDIATHQIYTTLLNDYEGFTRIRNTIAHGRGSIHISKSMLKELFYFILVLFGSWELSLRTFTDLQENLLNARKQYE